MTWTIEHMAEDHGAFIVRQGDKGGFGCGAYETLAEAQAGAERGAGQPLVWQPVALRPLAEGENDWGLIEAMKAEVE